LRLATVADRQWIYRTRHDVYAVELGQHEPNPEGRIIERIDEKNIYIVAARNEYEPVGFVSVTPPWAGPYSFEKYLTRAELPELADEGLFEARVLTVLSDWRGSPVASLLMYAVLRWIQSRGGRQVVIMGRTELEGLYTSAGMIPLNRTVRSGRLTFRMMHGDVAELVAATTRRHGFVLQMLSSRVRWRLDFRPLPPKDCEHGGTSFEASGALDAPERHRDVVPADVLDAWFDPAPAVVSALGDNPGWLARTSPSSGAARLIEAIAAAREVPPEAVVVGAGSSDLIFRAFRTWLDKGARVLLLDPTYGEYSHITERVLGCRVTRLWLRSRDGWRLDPERLYHEFALNYDLVVLVNPNNPAGGHIPAVDLRAVLDAVPASTVVWIDEAYVDYVGSDESLEAYAAACAGTVVCKSMSKVYALSGLRAAYLVGPVHLIDPVRRWTPPWVVGLSAQLAMIRALRDKSYYEQRWRETRELRAQLAAELARACPFTEVTESAANFVLLGLPAGGPAATKVVADCRAEGVHLRDLSPVSSAFEGRTIRIAVRRPDDNDRVIRTLQKILMS
jgi:histidinol-phosphate/aromatic aminotransferase/cobyric acid decarboxylase-like protein